MIKKAGIVAAVAAALAAQAAQAQDYQMEAGLSYAHIDMSNFAEDSGFGIDFTYHFDRVQTSGRPLAEAAFLGRASNVSVSYLTMDDSETDVLSGGLEFYFGDFYLAGDVDKISNGTDSTDYSVAAGWLPVDGLRLAVGYTDLDAAATSAITLDAKYVVALANDTALNLEGNLAMFDDDEDTKVYRLQGDYYFNPALSVGLRYQDSDVSGADATWGAGARYFFTPTISGAVEYSTDDFIDAWAARVAIRF